MRYLYVCTLVWFEGLHVHNVHKWVQYGCTSRAERTSDSTVNNPKIGSG